MPHPLPATSRRAILSATIAALLLSACGGGTPGTTAGPSPGPAPTPTPTSGQCSLLDRQRWAEGQIREWYLFPEDLPASINPAQYATLDDFIDALTANARAAGKDRFFTFATSIAEENAFINQGQTAAFGIRISYNDAARTATVIDAFETGPAFAAGLRRGAQLLAIGDTPSGLVTVNDLFARGGSNEVADALGPAAAGITRTIRFFSPATGDTTVTITKTVFNIPPVSPLFGVRVLARAGQQVGYINLRTFIDTANPALRDAFQQLRTAGISKAIIDFRYNSGGLVETAELMGDLMGGGRLPGDVFSRTVFRPSKSAENETRLFRSAPQAIAPTDLAFITTDASASASELVIASMLPYTRGRIALVGSNTSGKPVGQIAIDRPACDDRLRIVAFATQNSLGDGDYYTGLKPLFDRRGERSCAAIDTPAVAMGDPGEDATGVALAAITGGICQPISSVAGQTAGAPDASIGAVGTGFTRQPLLRARRPSPAQRDMPGTF